MTELWGFLMGLNVTMSIWCLGALLILSHYWFKLMGLLIDFSLTGACSDLFYMLYVMYYTPTF